jgi:hypothetical protein
VISPILSNVNNLQRIVLVTLCTTLCGTYFLVLFKHGHTP